MKTKLELQVSQQSVISIRTGNMTNILLEATEELKEVHQRQTGTDVTKRYETVYLENKEAGMAVLCHFGNIQLMSRPQAYFGKMLVPPIYLISVGKLISAHGPDALVLL